jgi:hypothetical protein
MTKKHEQVNLKRTTHEKRSRTTLTPMIAYGSKSPTIDYVPYNFRIQKIMRKTELYLTYII